MVGWQFSFHFEIMGLICFGHRVCLQGTTLLLSFLSRHNYIISGFDKKFEIK